MSKGGKEGGREREKEKERGACIKDSLTYHPSSQGWASRVLPLIYTFIFFVCLISVSEVGFTFFLLYLN